MHAKVEVQVYDPHAAVYAEVEVLLPRKFKVKKCSRNRHTYFVLCCKNGEQPENPPFPPWFHLACEYFLANLKVGYFQFVMVVSDQWSHSTL